MVHVADEKLPPGYSRETRIRRDAQGRWFDGDDPIRHENLSRSFDRWLDVAPDGRFCLVNDINWAYIEVDGPPVFVRSVCLPPEVTAPGEVRLLRLRLSGDIEESLDPSTLRASRDGRLYCSVREGRLAAELDSHAAAQLLPLLVAEEAGFALEIDGHRHPIPIVEAPLYNPPPRSDKG